MSQGRDDLVICIEGMFPRGDQHTDSKPKIFLVVNHPHQANENDYAPKKVSIGPIHHRNDGVKSMEQHKVRFLQELLRERDDLNLEILVEEVRKMEGDARRCYSEPLNLDKITFLKMLLLDCCFIIQLLRRYFSGKSNNQSQMLIQIAHDLLLFENQLPFFVLTRLFDKIKTRDSDDHLHLLILHFVREIVPWLDHSKAQFPPDSEPDHLLGLVYSYMSTKIPRNHHPYSSAELYNPLVIHKTSASELMDAWGIVIKMSKDNRITFSGKVLSVPLLHVYPETESLLWNLMAYEQLQMEDISRTSRYCSTVTDNMYFLHCLARSIKDVEILQHSRIVRNYIGGDEKILQMFDRLGPNYMGSFMDTYSYIFKSLNKHCSNRCNRYMASLKRNYFNTPWSVISLLAATFLLLLTVAQTVLAVLSFTEQKP